MEDPSPGQILSRSGFLAVTPHRPSKAAPEDSQGTSPENPHSQKQNKTKNPEKWRQAGISNPKVLVFIQTRAQHCSVPNAPKPFCLREMHIWPRQRQGRAAWSPEPALPACLCSCPGPAPPPQNKQQNTLSRFLSTPRVSEPSAPALPWGGREGGAAALPPPPTALTETLF